MLPVSLIAGCQLTLLTSGQFQTALAALYPFNHHGHMMSGQDWCDRYSRSARKGQSLLNTHLRQWNDWKESFINVDVYRSTGAGRNRLPIYYVPTDDLICHALRRRANNSSFLPSRPSSISTDSRTKWRRRELSTSDTTCTYGNIPRFLTFNWISVYMTLRYWIYCKMQLISMYDISVG